MDTTWRVAEVKQVAARAERAMKRWQSVMIIGGVIFIGGLILRLGFDWEPARLITTIGTFVIFLSFVGINDNRVRILECSVVLITLATIPGALREEEDHE